MSVWRKFSAAPDLRELGEFRLGSPELPDAGPWSSWGAGGPIPNRHCFVEDRRLERFYPEPPAPTVAGSWIIGPDFTICTGMPGAVQAYQRWRACVAHERLEAAGWRVVPVLQYADAGSAWLGACGIARGAVVAVRAPGREASERSEWARGLYRIVERIEPVAVLVFGTAARVRADLRALGVVVGVCPLRSRSGGYLSFLPGSGGSEPAGSARSPKHPRPEGPLLAQSTLERRAPGGPGRSG